MRSVRERIRRRCGQLAALLLATSVGGAMSCASDVSARGRSARPESASLPTHRGEDAPPSNPLKPVEQGRIVIDCLPRDASVLVNGTSHGTALEIGTAGIALPPGIYRLELSRSGYQPLRIELKLGTKPEPLHVRLKPLEP